MLQADYWGTPLASNRSHKSYRPLTVFSFHLNHVMHGITPQGYHFVNIVLHGVATMLFTHLLYTTVFTQAQQGLSPELSLLLIKSHKMLIPIPLIIGCGPLAFLFWQQHQQKSSTTATSML
jgi:hypothetical protein